MSEQDRRQAPALQRPTKGDPEEWKAYWETQGQRWRTEPEIDTKRQKELAQRRAVIPDIKQGIYPFKDMKLSRADVEWLLATLENGRGPIDWGDKQQRRRQGLDMRGANLFHEDLSDLPLACMQGGLKWKEWIGSTEEQTNMAAVCMEKADLRGAQLQEANFEGAQLQKANLEGAQLQKAYLGTAQLQEANLGGIQLQKANLGGAQLQKANLEGAQLQKAYLGTAQLQEANLGGIQLQGANLVGAQLQGAQLGEAQLQKAYLGGAQLQKAYLGRAQLQKAELGRVQLQGAVLSEAQLDSVDLREAILSDKKDGSALLADVRWGEINLAVVDWTPVKRLGDEQLAHLTKAINDYRAAVRANRQLAVVLREQGLNEEANHFAYRAQLLQRTVWQLQRRPLKFLLSWFLYLLAGYGYRPLRSLLAYLVILFVFMGLYLLNAHFVAPHLTWDEALVLSVSSFHGRGFFTQNVTLGDTYARLAAVEAIVGLFIEISFIATFTQRFFGK